MKKPNSAIFQLVVLFLVASLFDGCGSTRSFISDSPDPEKATIYFHRISRFVGGGGDKYVLDDSNEMPPNAIIGFGPVSAPGAVYYDKLLWGYLNTSGQSGDVLFGTNKVPDESYARLDAYLGESRSKHISKDVSVRRTTIIGSVGRGETLKWTRPPGTFRFSVAGCASSFGCMLYVGEWMKVSAGRSYRISYDVATLPNPTFTVEELR